MTRILLRSSWQTVNIGDIAHTPGALHQLWSRLPEADITLWPCHLGQGVRELLLRSFPRLRLAEGDVDEQGRPATPALAAAFAESDVLVHGSGPGLVAQRQLEAWRRHTGKPYGALGITMDPLCAFAGGALPGCNLAEARAMLSGTARPQCGPAVRDLIAGSAFWYCRDSLTSLGLAAEGVPVSRLAFGPDATCTCPLRDPAGAGAWLAANRLAAQSYLCVIPRLRYTPYHRIHATAPSAIDLAKDALNEQHRTADMEVLRRLIIAWVRGTGRPVVACPEMTYEVELTRQELVDPLPEDVRAQVVWRSTYWLPDEAASVYAQAAAVVSMECHSPLLALSVGTPFVHLRLPTDTIKAEMYRDLGLEQCLVEIGAGAAERLIAEVLAVHAQPAAARAVIARAQARIAALQDGMVDAVERSAGWAATAS